MKTLIVLLLSLALVAPVFAAAPKTPAQLNAEVLRNPQKYLPPKHLDHKPTVRYKLDITPHWQIDLVCGKGKRGTTRGACTSTGPKGNWIFISDWLEGRAYQIVLRHEWGHLNAIIEGKPWNHH